MPGEFNSSTTCLMIQFTPAESSSESLLIEAMRLLAKNQKLNIDKIVSILQNRPYKRKIIKVLLLLNKKKIPHYL